MDKRLECAFHSRDYPIKTHKEIYNLILSSKMCELNPYWDTVTYPPDV